MSKKIYLLHYPDGRVSASVVAGMRPDAFLFDKGVWISFKMKFELSDYRQAVENVSDVRISGFPCVLLNREQLQSFLRTLTEINDLRQKCGYTPIPMGYFWAARPKESPYKVSLKLTGKRCIESYLSVNGVSPLSFAIPSTSSYKCLAQKLQIPISETYVETPDAYGG